MRFAFGQARLHNDPKTGVLSLEAPGLSNGNALLDLGTLASPTALDGHVGKVLQFQGQLFADPGANITKAIVIQPELLGAPETAQPTPVTVIAAGNLGGAPEQNDNKTAIVASLAVYLPDQREGAWLRLFAPLGHQAATQLQGLDKGTPILIAGQLETYSYKGKDGSKRDGLQVVPLIVTLLPRQAALRPAVLHSSPATAEAIPAGVDPFVG